MAGANKAPAFLAFCRHTTKIVSRLRIILSVLLYCKHSLPCKQPCKQPCKCTGKKLISVLAGEKGRSELQELLSIKNRDYFRTDYLVPAINKGYIEPTIPDKPNSQNQKYRLTAKGLALKEKLKHNE